MTDNVVTPMYMDCIVVGGVANGLFLRRIRADATFIKLGQPQYARPLEHSTQTDVEMATEEDVYEVHPLSLVNSHDRNIAHVYGIAVIEGQSLTWAFKQLVLSHVEKSVRELREQDSESLGVH